MRSNKGIINRKLKGNIFELTICKELSYWISDGKRGDLFVRNVTSGARTTVAHKKGIKTGIIGDVMAADEDPAANAFLTKYVIECKHWKDLNLNHALWNKRDEIYYQLNKTYLRCLAHKKIMLFIAKQNYYPTYLFMSMATAQSLNYCNSDHHILWNRRFVLMKFIAFIQNIRFDDDVENFLKVL